MNRLGENHSVETRAARAPSSRVAALSVMSRFLSRAKGPLRRNRTIRTSNGMRTKIARSRGGISGTGREVMMRSTLSARPSFGQPT
ncbi:hypothetical protein Sme01_66430 [Sphaerisporangium melleum]|uniref:Uncharacterized protein n=1 Tax=Sphaerisporangium melleum TaxID=321316 RepID=A0A917RG44_9ACTN|nr:hypothetical protein GCM10007964_55660 [Sphaerisporangium melleum]GII74167.1 hypothetical protein Sme01_66430 [Sphaerisporangium melleum]